jgi:hypothetical protein
MSNSPLFRVLLYFISTVPASSEIVPLVLPAGTPLQVRIEKRIRIKGVSQQIECRVVQPVFVFNKGSHTCRKQGDWACGAAQLDQRAEAIQGSPEW